MRSHRTRAVTRRTALGAGAGLGLGALVAAAPAQASTAPAVLTPSGRSATALPGALEVGPARTLGARGRRAAGDTVTTRAEVRDSGQRALGEVVVTAVVLEVRAAPGTPSTLETHLFRLPGGTLTGHGTVDSAGAGDLAVVGGTGRYTGATGAYRVTASPTGGRTVQFISPDGGGVAVAIYLVAVDNTGALVAGTGAPVRSIRDPFRANLDVPQPIVLEAYSFDTDLATSTGTGGTQVGAFTVGEIHVSMVEDAATAQFFRACYRGTVFRSLDVLATKSTNGGSREDVFYGIGVSNAVVSSIGFSGATGDDPRRTMTFTGKVFVVGSAVQKPDGTLTPFLTSTYDVTRNTGT